jgi:hypothetical protein
MRLGLQSITSTLSGFGGSHPGRQGYCLSGHMVGAEPPHGAARSSRHGSPHSGGTGAVPHNSFTVSVVHAHKFDEGQVHARQCRGSSSAVTVQLYQLRAFVRLRLGSRCCFVDIFFVDTWGASVLSLVCTDRDLPWARRGDELKLRPKL